jgi:hypothetical protein
VPSTLTVTSAADSGTGTLRYEINVAHSGDTVVFAPNLAGKTITLLYGELGIYKDLTIQGLGAGQLTVSGNRNTWRVFDVHAGAHVTLSGLTIANGSSTRPNVIVGPGGGILNQGTLTVSGCTLSNNRGSGIGNFGTLIVSGCTLSKNSGSLGGGIDNAGTANVTHCTLSTNTASLGGGVYNTGTLTVSTSTFSGNNPDNIRGTYTDDGGNTFS